MNSDKLSEVLNSQNSDLSALEIMRLYYPISVESGEGNEIIQTTETTLENGNIVVTLIHDNLLDDSVKGVKYLLELKKVTDKWTVISLKKNWKCWNDRGHTDWGIEFCN